MSKPKSYRVNAEKVKRLVDLAIELARDGESMDETRVFLRIVCCDDGSSKLETVTTTRREEMYEAFIEFFERVTASIERQFINED